MAYTKFVYTVIVKNITLSADGQLIEHARLVAQSRHTTLNAEFRRWLAQYAIQATVPREYESLMERLRHVTPGRRFSRDEMNER